MKRVPLIKFLRPTNLGQVERGGQRCIERIKEAGTVGQSKNSAPSERSLGSIGNGLMLGEAEIEAINVRLFHCTLTNSLAERQTKNKQASLFIINLLAFVKVLVHLHAALHRPIKRRIV